MSPKDISEIASSYPLWVRLVILACIIITLALLFFMKSPKAEARLAPLQDRQRKALITSLLGYSVEGAFYVHIEFCTMRQQEAAKALSDCFRQSLWSVSLGNLPLEASGEQAYFKNAVNVRSVNKTLAAAIARELEAAGFDNVKPQVIANQILDTDPKWPVVSRRVVIALGDESEK